MPAQNNIYLHPVHRGRYHFEARRGERLNIFFPYVIYDFIGSFSAQILFTRKSLLEKSRATFHDDLRIMNFYTDDEVGARSSRQK